MAVGKNSLEFIAFMARRGWGDESIRSLYDFAQPRYYLSSSSRKKWLEAEGKWYDELTRKSGSQDSADRS